MAQSYIKFDQIRIKALTSEANLQSFVPHKLLLSESRETALIMTTGPSRADTAVEDVKFRRV